ncbi:MAG: hypothetical protein R3Y62_08520 [Eubacteriales bacterium]
MKTAMTLAVAAALALSLTACGGTTMATHPMGYDHYGNVSTTNDGTVNGSNHYHHQHGNTTVPQVNTNAMGAGNY